MKDKGERLSEANQNFALRVIRLCTGLPKTTEAQVLRSGTSVGTHYREGCRAKSDADFISKIEGALQELDETSYWLELIDESNIFNSNKSKPLQSVTEELRKIFVTVVKKC